MDGWLGDASQARARSRLVHRPTRLGGHDPRKVYAAYKAAVEHKSGPTVILARTIKGYGLGEAGEGRNITHQQKKLNEDEIEHFRSRFQIPLPDDAARHADFYLPPADSPEMAYLQERRRGLGGCDGAENKEAKSVRNRERDAGRLTPLPPGEVG